MLYKNIVSFLLIAICTSSVLQAQFFSVEKIAAHIQYLASDKLQGRAPGTKGEKLSQKYIIKEFEAIGLSPKGSEGFLQPFQFNLSLNPHDAKAGGVSQKGSNIVGYLDNNAPYTIIIGGHYDHLGKGEGHFSLDADPKGKIHNGADDNASGTAGVIELARYFAKNNIQEKCNFLFICFSAEESGLIGSKYYTEHPTIELNKVQCMFNMDMIGRLNEERNLMVFGIGTSPVFVPLLANTKNDFTIKTDSAGVGPSDQTSFYLKDIPVLFFFTGVHSDYHKPSDDFEKINTKGETEVLSFVAKLADSLANYPKIPFLKTRTKEKQGAAFKVSLGIMPDYSFDKGGVRADDVVENKPAKKAGLQKGDIILQIGDYPTNEIYAYMEALAKFKAGDKTTVKVKRGEEIKTFEIKF